LIKHLEKKPIYQPDLTTYLYYGNGELQRLDGVIYNKFIKKEVFIRALNKLNDFYINLHMIYSEDVLITHIIYITANSFFFLKTIGYYYKRNNNSITKNIISELKIKAVFIHLKLILEYYKNKKYERDIINDILMIFNKGIEFKKKNKFIKVKNIYNYNDSLNIYNDIINKFINCVFISDENKKLLYNLKQYYNIKQKEK